jgi:hypothetical protein
MSTADHIFCFYQILVGEKNGKYSEAVRQLFIYLKKACDSVRKPFLYNTLIEFGIPMELARLIKIGMKPVAETG